MVSVTSRARVLTRRLRRRHVGADRSVSRRSVAAASVLALTAGLVPTATLVTTPAYAAPVGQGFNLNADDLRFILKQIKISEHHAAHFNPEDPCAGLVGDGPNQIPVGGNTRELPWGLRTVDGTCNNLMPGQEKYGAADETFPRSAGSDYMDGEAATFDSDGPGPTTVGGQTSYDIMSRDVFDSQPRVVSNLVVDQTVNNPAATAAAGEVTPDPASGALSIPNVAPDVGLSAPFNSVFTLFGQFFDHGLDLVAKGGNGTVYMPLKADDPLIAGKDGIFGNADDLPPQLRFMAVSRATLVPGTREATNLTTPFVDQNQTYTSHPSHQVFLRDYQLSGAGKPAATGQLLTGAAGGQATWKDTKNQARAELGIALDDQDLLNVPLLATDPYGNFLPGPNGMPQLVTPTGLVEGNLASPVDATQAQRSGHAFLDDIAHHAVPFGDPTGRGGPGQPLTPDTDPGTTPDTLSDGRPNNATYDDEMLDAHFVAGDGRVNENIGLTAIHHVFHSEHNRLAGPQNVDGTIKHVLVTEDPSMVAEWKLPDGSWNGERIFQAAKFVTEMEYQHLVFEEFARKVQPMVNPFGEGGTGYNTSINPAIRAEFAHAVYRFGHSMLTETVARRNADGTPNNIALLDAFLNPPSFNNGGAAGQLSADRAAGSIFRGMSRQVGNEIDEFVTPALRSNLLGLPLDLAAINMARARETGVPSLNAARAQFFAATNNPALEPYSSWMDFGFSLRHRESLVNFVAAYGQHPTVLNATTLAAKRQAAQLLVDPPVDADPATIPADAADFMEATGTWAAKETGLNLVDLWVGGLAEKQMVFGGLLGSTFNYVFEMQMEDLQFGDRFYYLSRTAGLNLLTQLEGNSFAELVMRNTDVDGLPADAFSRPDYVFNVGRLGTSGPITDDPTTEDYNEGDRSQEPGVDLTRMVDGTIRYSGPAHVVFNGTAGNDQVRASEGDDTVRGNDGNDRVEGGDGVDNLIGGLGDDILTDLFGDDTIKGGDGNDAIASGQGFGADLNQGGRGKDFVVSGNDAAETFAGQGDDFVLGGDGDDVVFGDEGDDWIEGGRGAFNLLQGDSGNPFQDDPNGGDDVIDGDGGEQDFDSEGGDDVMLAGPGIQRAEGMLGFDWVIHKGDPQPADADMSFTGLLPPTVGTLRDRFDMVEGLSGWRFDDVLRGDNGLAAAEGGIGTPEDHSLDPQAIAKVAGLADLLPAGATSFSDGNIVLGGAGSDTMEGRGGDDIVHGDAWLDVQLRVPDLSTTTANDTVVVDGMTSTALVQNDVPVSLRQLVMAGRINPGDITIQRRIRVAPGVGDEDTAVYSNTRANYNVTRNADGSVTVEDLTLPPAPEPGEVAGPDDALVVNDGTDTLYGVERLVFADTLPPEAPTSVTAAPGNQSATVSWTAPTVGVVDSYNVKVTDVDGNQLSISAPIAPGAVSHLVQNLTNGREYRFAVRANNAAGEGAWSALTDVLVPVATTPESPTMGALEPGDGQVTVNWTAQSDGGSPITGYEVEVRNVAGNLVAGAPLQATATANRLTVRGLTNGNQYWFSVRALNTIGSSPLSAESVAAPGTAPGQARIDEAVGHDGAATVNWRAPLDDGGSGVTEYQIRVVDSTGAQVGGLRVANAAETSRRIGGLTNGQRYRFQVAAVNEMGRGELSELSNGVVPGSVPGAPVIRRPEAGDSGGRITATARWAPPPGVTSPEVTSYQVIALKMESRDADARVLRRIQSPVVGPRRSSLRLELPKGVYRFQVVAWNARGKSAPSLTSRAVRAR
jgi:hypothetical protein